jgi:hypothetical protein
MQIAERSSPTLLNLPTELRNTIFSYVYGKAVADHIILLLRFKSGRAGVELDKAPPNKDSLLICRQFYNEMKGLQAVAYRRYWAVQKFLIIADRDTKKDLHLATIADLRHICNLAVHRCFAHPEKYTALISFHCTAASTWIVTMTSCRPQPTMPGGDSPWYMIESLRSIGFLKRLETMMGSLLRKDDGTRCDPRAGRGLGVDALHQLPSFVRRYRTTP